MKWQPTSIGVTKLGLVLIDPVFIVKIVRMRGKTRLAHRGWMYISSGQLEKIALAIKETIYPESTVDRGVDKAKDNPMNHSRDHSRGIRYTRLDAICPLA